MQNEDSVTGHFLNVVEDALFRFQVVHLRKWRECISWNSKGCCEVCLCDLRKWIEVYWTLVFVLLHKIEKEGKSNESQCVVIMWERRSKCNKPKSDIMRKWKRMYKTAKCVFIIWEKEGKSIGHVLICLLAKFKDITQNLGILRAL